MQWTPMLPGLKPAARTSLSEHIVDQITGLIRAGALKPGDRIPSEKQLCEQFAVGRTSVREALKALAGMGVLESHPGDGTFISLHTGQQVERVYTWSLLLDRKALDDLIETRLLLESDTAGLAAGRATDADLAEIAASIRGMQDSLDDRPRYLEQDLRFHMAIGKATQNSILLSLLSTTRAYLQAWIQETLQRETAVRRARLSVAEHKRILAALRKKDPEAARRAMAAHVLSSSRDLGG